MANAAPRTTPELLLKIAQCLVYCSDYIGDDGDAEDLAGAIALWTDPDVRAWITTLHHLGLVNLKERRCISVKQST